MIDLHCHLLPGVDDGPATMAEALELARAQVAAGVDRAVATPHVMPTLANDAASIAAGVVELRQAIDQACVPLDVSPGGEVDLDYAVTLDDDELRALTFGGGHWLLLEAPLRPHPGVELAVGELMVRGHCVLLAHPERAPAFQRDRAALGRLVRDGALLQVTAGSFIGRFGRAAEQLATELAKERLIHVVASDAHDLAGRRPGMRDDLEAARLDDRAAWWTEEVPAALLHGEPLPPAPKRRRPAWLRG